MRLGALVAAAALASMSAAPVEASIRIPRSQPTVLLLAAHQARDRPAATGAIVAGVRAWRPITGRSTVLPVLARRTAADGLSWLQVRLPGRVLGQVSPAREGWIRASSTVALSTSWHLLVRLSSREVIVFRDGRRVRSFSAVIGAPVTPTPTGEYFVEEPVRLAADAAGAPFAFALSARSNVLQEFEGGPGQVAIHGRRRLGGALGTAASHGCVRITDLAVSWLARRIGRGVPVTIR